MFTYLPRIHSLPSHLPSIPSLFSIQLRPICYYYSHLSGTPPSSPSILQLATHTGVDLVPEVVEITCATQATHLPNGVIGGDAMVTPAVEIQTHQVHAEPELWRLVGD